MPVLGGSVGRVIENYGMSNKISAAVLGSSRKVKLRAGSRTCRRGRWQNGSIRHGDSLFAPGAELLRTPRFIDRDNIPFSDVLNLD